MKNLLLLFACVVLTITVFTQPFDSDPDKDILEQVWMDMNQPALAGWNFDPAVELNNSWEGINMTADGDNILTINLVDKSLTGIVSPELGSLTSLIVLQLSFNQFSGTIPQELGSLTSLNILVLSFNQLTGNIPPELGSLTSLIDLALNGNQLSGNIPTALGNLTSLTSLTLRDNQLTGNIPSELGNLTSLVVLYLDNNQLSGSIPSELGNLTSVTQLFLYNNQLSGNIPPELGNLTSIAFLFLDNNLLSGNIPIELGGLSTLTDLSLEDNQLSGCIPSSFQGYCSSAIVLLNDNPMLDNDDFSTFCSGDIGACLFPSDNDKSILEQVWIDMNQPALTGWNFDPAVELNNSWEGITMTANGANISIIDLSSKSLTGIVSPALGSLTSLTELDFRSNQLSGNIPRELGNLTSLSILGLLGNELSGNIPTEIGSLTSLTELVLTGNQLSGNIPAELGNLTLMTRLLLTSNQLTGNIPTELGNFTSLILIGLNDNQLSGCIPSSFQNYCSNAIVFIIDNPMLDNDNFNTFCNSGVGECLFPSDNNKTILEQVWMDMNQPALAGWNFNSAVELNNSWEGITMTANGANISIIDLSSKSLTGIVSPALGGLTSLTELDFRNNQLSGSIPPELGSLTSLSKLDLLGNNLTGNIPTEMGSMTSLTDIVLTGNQLSGNIPPELGNLTSMTRLLLTSNQLSGNIPTELGNFTSLILLGLNDNQLSGCIPESFMDYCSNAIVFMIDNPMMYNDDFQDFCLTSNGMCGQILTVQVKAFLQGPYLTGTDLMSDVIRSHESFPLQSPYGSMDEEITDPNVLLINDDNAIVDWIYLELRDGDNPSTILQSKSALLQKDGDVVSHFDGVSPVTFSAPTSETSVLVAIGHRNHLGIRNADQILTTGNDQVIQFDFTNIALNVLGANDAAANIEGVRALFSGDANGDGQVNSIDKNGFWRLANGQPYEYNFSSSDFNLDGAVNTSDKNSQWRLNNGKASFFD